VLLEGSRNARGAKLVDEVEEHCSGLRKGSMEVDAERAAKIARQLAPKDCFHGSLPVTLHADL
jgi:hypothetical protein